jgi:hypothetical protein
VPAAAVIPAPIVYTHAVAAVKKLVVGFWRVSGDSMFVATAPVVP